MKHGRLFFEAYLGGREETTIVDVGAQDVNGSLRSVAPPHATYIGVDFTPGPGVDVVLDDPYRLPFENESVDVVVTSSCFEHAEFFWLSYLEILRILKPGGLFYLNAPSNGEFHRFPVDCWRFYPDSGIALQNWGRRNGVSVTLLESFVGNGQGGGWNDCVAVFVKGDGSAVTQTGGIQALTSEYTNGYRHGADGLSKLQVIPEDQNGLCDRIRRYVFGRLGWTE